MGTKGAQVKDKAVACKRERRIFATRERRILFVNAYFYRGVKAFTLGENSVFTVEKNRCSR
jgi:hypothetical protein